MKKVLVFFPHPLVKRHGGPYSALYHLREGLKCHIHSVHFLSDLISFEENKTETKQTPSQALQFIKRLLPQRWINYSKIEKWRRELKQSVDIRIESIDLNQYHILHFHETIDIWRYKHLLKNFTGHIALTSHSPKPYHRELLEDVFALDIDQVDSRSLKWLKQIDAFAYSKTNYCIFPCKEASESYYQLWDDFGRIVPLANIISIATGVAPSNILQDRDTLRKARGIPENAFVVTFIGRQMAVKGFDLLVNLACKVLPIHQDVYFLVIGRKEKNTGYSNDRWIETGWTNDPLSFIKAGDLHLVPNRYANFDLNILEALSIGQPILLSDIGGNKYLKLFNSEGLFFHNTDDDSYFKVFKQCYALKNQLAQSGLANKELYENYFTSERFAIRHLEFYNTID